ncbi:MAG: C40 family peptidase [Dysgonamonadaceae bacterium]|jgi:hypothetical protein|nr:C40 family peptidase [Dysgonamonadaceae bacterium]
MYLSQSQRNIYCKIFYFLLISLALASCGTSKKVAISESSPGSLEKDLIAYGKKFLHTPYRPGGQTPGGFDCSGFTSFVYQKFGYRLHKSSSGQALQVPAVYERKELKIGDLVFFEGRKQNGSVGHVGIVTEVKANGQFRFIHSSTSNGVIISSSEEPYYKSRYVKGGRVIDGNKYYSAKRTKAPKKQVSEKETSRKQKAEKKDITVVNPDNTPQLTSSPGAETAIKESSPLPINKARQEPENREKEKERIIQIIQSAMSQQEPTTVPKPAVTVLPESENADDYKRN